MEKKNKVERLNIFQLKIYDKVTVSNPVGTGSKKGHRDQWNRNESPEITPCVYGTSILDKGAKMTKWGKNSLSTNINGTNRYLCAKSEAGPPTPYRVQKLIQNGPKSKI